MFNKNLFAVCNNFDEVVVGVGKGFRARPPLGFERFCFPIESIAKIGSSLSFEYVK